LESKSVSAGRRRLLASTTTVANYVIETTNQATADVLVSNINPVSVPCRELGAKADQFRNNATDLRRAYDDACEDFNTQYHAYLSEHDAYTKYQAAVGTNLGIVQTALKGATLLQNSTDNAKAKLIITAVCEPSSICCQIAEVGSARTVRKR
jgi:hypothetical protein